MKMLFAMGMTVLLTGAPVHADDRPVDATALADEMIVPMTREAAMAKTMALVSAKCQPDQLAAIEAIWEGDQPTLESVVFSFAVAMPEIKRAIDQSRHREVGAMLPEAIFGKEPVDPFIRSNVALYLARDWTRRKYLDEAASLLKLVAFDQLVDPATYLFQAAVCQVHFHERSEALATLLKLERVTDLPERYRTLAILMRKTLEPLKKDDLTGIAHDMREIRRRLEVGKADQKTVEVEKDVIARLDKLIKKMEEQRQNQQQASNSNQSNRPADDSRPMGAKGEGKVADRTFKNKDSWGNLPPKERERAMQELGREFPAHYRDAIEEYFKSLAKQKDGSLP